VSEKLCPDCATTVAGYRRMLYSTNNPRDWPGAHIADSRTTHAQIAVIRNICLRRHCVPSREQDGSF
jgi:hypothetical protein